MRRWTSAICADTEAEDVPIGIRQKSAVQCDGVGMDSMDSGFDMIIVIAASVRCRCSVDYSMSYD